MKKNSDGKNITNEDFDGGNSGYGENISDEELNELYLDYGDGYVDEIIKCRDSVKSRKNGAHSNYDGDKNVYKNNVAEDDEDDLEDLEEMRREYGEEFVADLEKRRKNGWTEWEIKDGVLRHYGGNIMRVIVPDGVTEIGDGAFSSNKWLKEVILPNTVKKLGARAFGWCEGLEKIELPDSVEEIGERAFVDCGYLKKVKFGNGLKIIGSAAFWRCSNFKKIKIPKSVIRIGDWAFRDCIRLIDAEIDDAEATIGEQAFAKCAFWGICIGDRITEIGDGAFANSDIIRLTIPKSTKKIGKGIFDGCGEFHWAQCMAESKPAGWHKNWDANKLAEGKRVKTVWNWGFTNGVIDYYDKSKFFIEGNKLKKYIGGEREITIPDGVYTVAEHTFDDCEVIDKLIIPASVKWFEDDLNWGRVKVKSVHFLGTFDEWKEVYFEDDDIFDDAEEIFIGDKQIK